MTKIFGARQAWMLLVAGFGLMALSGCGSHRDMVAGEAEDNVGLVHGADDAFGSDASAGLAKRHSGRAGKQLKKGDTRSAPGKLTSVTVAKGDTLWKIAERSDIYASGWLYPLLYKANRAAIKDPNALEAGTVLMVPRDLAEADMEIAMEEAMTGQILDSSPLSAAKPTPVPAPAAAAPAPKPEPAGKSGGWKLLFFVLALVAGLWIWMRRKSADSDF